MWKKSLDATPISISSDRICGLRLKMPPPETAEVTILGVYLPCTDMGIDCYGEHLIELERLISEGQQLGPIVITGDFNAHLGTLGGVRGRGSPNQQGILLHQLLVWCKLYAVSLSSLSEGPQYTFWNSTTRSTVDYIIASQEASDYIQRCFTREPAPLNNSDHLPISAVLCLPTAAVTSQESSASQKINWTKVPRSSQLISYQQQVSYIVNPLLGKPYNCPDELNADICSVSQQLCSAALKTLPLRSASKQKKKWYRYQTLARLALQKKAAWDEWTAGGRPVDGPLHDAKTKTRADFRKRMKICVAIDERKRIQHFDQQFKKKTSNRFKPPSKRRQQGLSLLINQQVTSDPHTILSTWWEHFTKLSATNEEEFPAISSMKERVKQLMTASFKNDDSLLDVPFCAAEVDAILRKLKPGKSAGHDMLQAEHLKYGGPILHEWIRQICNSIIDLEHVPDSLKMGIVIPVYKGGGKDPLDTNSYRGITLTSVIAKVLESLVLARLRDHLTERGIPH